LDIDIIRIKYNDLFRSTFAWGRRVCPVCKEAEKVSLHRQDRCLNCILFGIFARCDYIGEFWDQAGKYDGEIGDYFFNKEEVEYMQDLFANYIRQIGEQLEELK
jgi:hypothetical protein